MVKMIDSISNELSSDNTVECTDWDEFKKQSIVHRLFFGRREQVITCNVCGQNSSTRYEPFCNLKVPVPPKQQKVNECEKDIEVVIKNKLMHVKENMNDYTCDGCGKSVNCQKVVSIVNLPPILIVHLDRCGFNKNNGKPMKRHTNMEYAWNMELQGIKYRLKSMICHSSSSSYGHHWE